MNKLFELNNIESKEFIDEEGSQTTIVYNDDLLEKNVLIKFFKRQPFEYINPSEIETMVFVISCNDERSYTFALLRTTEIIAPLLICRTIVDAVNFIACCNRETILTELVGISIYETTSDNDEDEDFNRLVYEDNCSEFKAFLEAIKENRGQTNKKQSKPS